MHIERYEAAFQFPIIDSVWWIFNANYSDVITFARQKTVSFPILSISCILFFICVCISKQIICFSREKRQKISNRFPPIVEWNSIRSNSSANQLLVMMNNSFLRFIRERPLCLSIGGRCTTVTPHGVFISFCLYFSLWSSSNKNIFGRLIENVITFSTREAPISYPFDNTEIIDATKTQFAKKTSTSINGHYHQSVDSCKLHNAKITSTFHWRMNKMCLLLFLRAIHSNLWTIAVELK